MKSISRIQFSLLFFSGLAAIAILSNCGGVNSVYYDGRGCLDGITSSSTGPQVYAAACSGCHGAVETSAKKGADLVRLNGAIVSVASMKYLSCMTEAQKNAVVAALANP